jgi:2-aminoethylphosphonate-pyruvate transaminase
MLQELDGNSEMARCIVVRALDGEALADDDFPRQFEPRVRMHQSDYLIPAARAQQFDALGYDGGAAGGLNHRIDAAFGHVTVRRVQRRFAAKGRHQFQPRGVGIDNHDALPALLPQQRTTEQAQQSRAFDLYIMRETFKDYDQMQVTNEIPAARDKLLFTPGPLTTSQTVKQAMLRDAGSWHSDFNALVADVRLRLLRLAGLSREQGWEAILLQGSGTFGVESIFQTCVPPDGKVVVLANGAYGERIAQMLKCARIVHHVVRAAEDAPADAAALESCLAGDPAVTHVAVVHCETTTGLLNPIDSIGRVAKRHGKTYVVDAMSSFGGMPIDIAACGIDFLVSSSNKCIEGVPGFSFVLCRRDALLASEGWARSLSLDLLGQLKGFEKDGKFRYTPPTHVILAFDQALRELELEGGVPARHERYRRNHETLLAGMDLLEFKPYLIPALQSPIITAFLHPPNGQFEFERFYTELSRCGFLIYPGKLTQVDTFRIANIGRLFPADMEQLVAAIGSVWSQMAYE